MFHQTAATSVMIIARGCRAPEAFTEFTQERLTKSFQAGIGNRADRFCDELPIFGLLCAEAGRSLEQFIPLLLNQRTDVPLVSLEPELRVLLKFARELNEVTGRKHAASLVSGMISPDPQRHAIAGVGQRQFAVLFSFPRKLRRRVIDLNVNTRGQ